MMPRSVIMDFGTGTFGTHHAYVFQPIKRRKKAELDGGDLRRLAGWVPAVRPLKGEGVCVPLLFAVGVSGHHALTYRVIAVSVKLDGGRVAMLGKPCLVKRENIEVAREFYGVG